eukprot:538766-Ditylum_brightwellii.AAC.1
MDVIHQDMYRIRDSMAETSEGGKKVIDSNEVPSITSDGPQMRIKVKDECLELGRQSEDMKKHVDQE